MPNCNTNFILDLENVLIILKSNPISNQLENKNDNRYSMLAFYVDNKQFACAACNFNRN